MGDGERAVVLGAGGLLGSHVVRALGVGAVGFDRAACPIDDPRRVREAVAGARVVWNCAAFTDVDGAERDPEGAHRVNAAGAENVARAAAEAGAVCVHVSTDFVFDGAIDRPYDELDLPRPLSCYGRSKREGELLVERAAPRSHLVRVQALYGPGGRNFASRLPSLLRSGKPLRIDRERRVQPTSARAAARLLVAIAASDRFGTWHLSARGETTWHGFTARLAAKLGVAPSWEPVPSSALTLPAARPANCCFAHRRLALHGLPLPPTWEEAQDEFLDEISTTGAAP